MSKEKKKAPQDFKFEVEGKIYQFEAPAVRIKLPGQDYRVVTPEEVASGKGDPDVLVHLVKKNSGVISVDEKATEKFQAQAEAEAKEAAAKAKAEEEAKAKAEAEKAAADKAKAEAEAKESSADKAEPAKKGGK